MFLILFLVLQLLPPVFPIVHRAGRSRTRSNQWVATKLNTDGWSPEGTTDTTKRSVSVVFEKKSYNIVEGILQQDNVVASGSFTDSIGSAGWGALEISSNAKFHDERQMYAAGLIEGFLTSERIKQLYYNDVSLRTDESLTGLYKFFEIQDRWLRSHERGGANYVKGSMFWKHAALEMVQLDGLTDGYNHAASVNDQLVLGDLWLLNMDGDVIDLERGINQGLVNITENNDKPVKLTDLVGGILHNSLRGPPQSLLETTSSISTTTTTTTTPSAMSHGYPRYSRQNWDRLMRHGRCSCLIKILPDYDDVFVGHATWADYSELIRIWKTYNLPLSNVASKQVSFSSYAGMISSTDDWYITDQQLLVTETTTQVEDVSILKEIDPHTQVVSWVRTMVANRLSTSGPEWSKNYVQGNSGTYNCQWMVLDYKLFAKKKPPLPGFFTMTEIIPGMYHYDDMTHTLMQRGEKKCMNHPEQTLQHKECMHNHMYWPSVNRPYWFDIRQRAGYPIENPNAANNAFFSFENNPRGNVFARDQGNIKTIRDMMQMMAYNDPMDRVQEDPGHGIASRYDLPNSDSFESALRPSGALDFKVTNSNSK
jgi:hypothetical protein